MLEQAFSAAGAFLLMMIYGSGGVLACAAAAAVWRVGVALTPRAHAALEIALRALAEDWRWSRVRAHALTSRD